MTSVTSHARWVAALPALLLLGTAQAEYLGLPNGRSANPDALSEVSVELGFVSGDLNNAGYQNFGARVNYRVSPELVVIGDIGLSEYANTDGTPVGLGLLYHLANQRINPALDIAAKVSYHLGEYEVSRVDLDLSGLSFEALFSGREPLAASGLNWYGNVGFHRLTIDAEIKDTDNEIGLGGGLTLPTATGEAYVGIDLIDEITFGIGFRYFVQ